MENRKVEWDESRAQDPQFLMEYYQSQADYWRANYPSIGKKIIRRYEQGVREQKRLLTQLEK